MSLFLNIIGFILLFGFLIIIHELGHFLVARLMHIEVEEFGLGFPIGDRKPLLHLFKLWGTNFTIHWIPFGGFCRMSGETDPSVPGGFMTAKPLARIAVLLSGPAMNLLAGVLVFAAVVSRIGAPDYKTVQLIEIAAGSPAESVGLFVGDIITEVNGQAVDSTDTMIALVKAQAGSPVTLTYLRDGSTQEVTLTPRMNPPEGQGAMGVVLGNPYKSINYLQAVPYGFQISFEQFRQLLAMPGQLIRGTIDPEEARFVGPKGIYDIYAEMRTRDEEASASTDPVERTSAVNTMWFIATISVALGLTNLLPLPALDGGRIIFILPEMIIRKRVPASLENVIHMVGFFLLILLLVYITFQDIVNPVVLP